MLLTRQFTLVDGKSICLGGKLRGAYFVKVRLHCIFCVRRIPQESEGTTIERG